MTRPPRTRASSPAACFALDQVVVNAADLPTEHDGQAGRAPCYQAMARRANLRELIPARLASRADAALGTFAVQIAKALGAEVTGVCSTRNVDLVRSLGADHVIDYTRTDVTRADFTRAEQRYDVILDNVEAQPLSAARRALTPTGTFIPNSGEGGRWIGPLGRIVKARVLSLFSRQRLRPFLSREKRQDLLALTELIENGKLTPVIDRTYPLSQAAGALEYVGEGHTQGKVVVTVGAGGPSQLDDPETHP